MASKRTEKRKLQKAGKIPINKVGVRNNTVVSKETRARISATQITNRLEDFVLDRHGVEMSPHQVSAALGLLKKVMPDLASVHSTNNSEKTMEDWLDELETKGQLDTLQE